jgi:mannose/cellobiose epimerase-like protein (N-acyl-D-glucosamine 2-epimerase family)
VVLVLGALLALAHAPPGLRPRATLPERVWAVLERVLRRPRRGAAAAARLQPVPARSRS